MAISMFVSIKRQPCCISSMELKIPPIFCKWDLQWWNWMLPLWGVTRSDEVDLEGLQILNLDLFWPSKVQALPKWVYLSLLHCLLLLLLLSCTKVERDKEGSQVLLSSYFFTGCCCKSSQEMQFPLFPGNLAAAVTNMWFHCQEAGKMENTVQCRAISPLSIEILEWNLVFMFRRALVCSSDMIPPSFLKGGERMQTEL